jgi:hypothetical protein
MGKVEQRISVETDAVLVNGIEFTLRNKTISRLWTSLDYTLDGKHPLQLLRCWQTAAPQLFPNAGIGNCTRDHSL